MARRSLAPAVSVLIVASALMVPALAHGQMTRTAETDDHGLFHVGAAYFDVTGRNGDAAALELAYRLPDPLFWRVGGQVGALLVSEGSAYGYAGLGLPLELGYGVVGTGSFGAGLYRTGDGTDLGSVVEFRSSLSLARRLPNGHRISLFFYHLSNAGIGERNPGVEVLGVGYALPW